MRQGRLGRLVIGRVDGLPKYVLRRFGRVYRPERVTWLVICKSFDSESQGKGEEGTGRGTIILLVFRL